MQLPIYLGLLHDAETSLADSWRRVADGHAAEADVHHLGHQLAGQCDEHIDRLARRSRTAGRSGPAWGLLHLTDRRTVVDTAAGLGDGCITLLQPPATAG